MYLFISESGAIKEFESYGDDEIQAILDGVLEIIWFDNGHFLYLDATDNSWQLV